MSFEEIYMGFLELNEDEYEKSMLDIYGIERKGEALELEVEGGSRVVWLQGGKVPIIDRYLCPTKINTETLVDNFEQFYIGNEDGKIYHLGR